MRGRLVLRARCLPISNKGRSSFNKGPLCRFRSRSVTVGCAPFYINIRQCDLIPHIPPFLRPEPLLTFLPRFNMGDGPVKDDFKCNCNNPQCDLEEKLRAKADVLGVSMGTAAFLLNTLKSTATLSPIGGLKEIAGGLLVIVSALQVCVIR